jgi:hypothetical protein
MAGSVCELSDSFCVLRLANSFTSANYIKQVQIFHKGLHGCIDARGRLNEINMVSYLLVPANQ